MNECLSGGEIQRIGLLRTWIKDNYIEFLDEPTAFLDEKNKNLVNKIILERSKNKIILVATHDKSLIDKAIM